MKLKWGILGLGAIANTFARGIAKCDNGVLVASGSRDQAKADAFAAEHGGKGHSSYDAVLADPAVEAVYIALPHHMHEEYTIKAAQAGKHILCEKPFTLNALEAERALAAVKAAGVFFMEAWMYRSHPQTLKVKELVRSGAIGQVRLVQANFGYAMKRGSDHFKADGRYGGGGLLDVGSYPVSFIRLVAGEEPTRCDYSADITDQGADGYGQGCLTFANGVRGGFATGVHLNMDNTATIYGDEGKIHLPSPWFCDGRILLHRGGETEEVPCDAVPDLWGNQASVVAQYLADKQSPTMNWDDTVGNMRTLDALRASAGLVFEFESKA